MNVGGCWFNYTTVYHHCCHQPPLLPSTTTTPQLMGERWRALTAEERIPFDELAAKDKARYQREMAVYKSKAAEGAVKAEEGGD